MAVNVYDGGVQRDAYRAAITNEDATRNAYNTSDSLLYNTRGGIASSTLDAYIELAEGRANIAYEEELVGILQRFKKFKNDPLVNSEIADIQAALDVDKATDHALGEHYKFYVKLFAFAQGPEVLRRQAEVEGAIWSLKGQKASYGPSLTLNMSVAHGRISDELNPSINTVTTDKSAGLTLTIPLDPSSHYRVAEAKSFLGSKKLERDGAVEKTKFAITSIYEFLEIAKKVTSLTQKSYAEQRALIKSILAKIDIGDTVDLDITKMMLAESTLRWREKQLVFRQRTIITNLFSLRQVTGLLFSKYAPAKKLTKL